LRLVQLVQLLLQQLHVLKLRMLGHKTMLLLLLLLLLLLVLVLVLVLLLLLLLKPMAICTLILMRRLLCRLPVLALAQPRVWAILPVLHDRSRRQREFGSIFGAGNVARSRPSRI